MFSSTFLEFCRKAKTFILKGCLEAVLKKKKPTHTFVIDLIQLEGKTQIWKKEYFK